MPLAEALTWLAVGYGAGFLVTAYLVYARWRGDWLWLSSWGERLSFYVWPKPPENIVRLVMLDGRSMLFYNVPVKSRKETVEIETPVGRVVAVERASEPTPLTAIAVKGVHSPLGLVVYYLSGLVFAWVAFYYGYVLSGLEVDAPFLTLVAAFLAYIYLWYQAVSTNNTEYHEYVATGIAPPYIHAIPSPNLVSPLRIARYLNQPILIRVTDQARRALESLKKALGIESDSQVAELLATAEYADIVTKKAVALRVESERIAQAFRATQILSHAVGRLTLLRLAVYIGVFIFGVVFGWLLSGGGVIVVGPPPEALAQAGG